MDTTSTNYKHFSYTFTFHSATSYIFLHISYVHFLNTFFSYIFYHFSVPIPSYILLSTRFSVPFTLLIAIVMFICSFLCVFVPLPLPSPSLYNIYSLPLYSLLLSLSLSGSFSVVQCCPTRICSPSTSCVLISLNTCK